MTGVRIIIEIMIIIYIIIVIILIIREINNNHTNTMDNRKWTRLESMSVCPLSEVEYLHLFIYSSSKRGAGEEEEEIWFMELTSY